MATDSQDSAAATTAAHWDRTAGSTFPSGPTPRWDKFERALRWFSVVVVFGIVILALFGFAGLATSRADTAGGDMTVRVDYATVSRPGLATPLTITIESTTGRLPDELTVEIPRAYFSMFDENGLDPAPDAVTSDGETEIWSFEPGDVSTLSIDFDARLQPNMHYGRDGWVIVRDGETDTDPGVRVDFHTRVMP
jgi:hypothetical protein